MIARSYTKTRTRTRTPYGVYRTTTKTRLRRRKVRGGRLFSWMGKAGKWLSTKVLPHAKSGAKTAFKLYTDPNVRAIADQYAGTKTKKYMGKLDKGIEIGNILKGATGRGRRIRMRVCKIKKKPCHCRGSGLGSYGGGLGNY